MKNSVKQSLAVIGAFIGFLVFAILGLVLSGKFLSRSVDWAIEKWPVNDYNEENDDEDPEPAEGAENPEPGQEQQQNDKEEEEKK